MSTAAGSGRKVWLITGCSGGFGHALASAVLAQGDSVAMTSRDPSESGKLVEKHAQTAAAYRLDLTISDDVTRVVAETRARFGRIDVLVNNAGYALLAAVEEASEAQYRALFDIDFFGAVAMMRAVLPGMRIQRAGCIVNISSMGGITGAAGVGYYAAAKAALGLLSESLAAETSALGIRVTVIEPGAHATAARANAAFGQTIEDYADTAGRNRRVLLDSAGDEPGDPDLAVRAIMRIVDEPDPPLHLPLGIDALQRSRAMIDQRQAILTKWDSLIRSTWSGEALSSPS